MSSQLLIYQTLDGKISHDLAIAKSAQEYGIFKEDQKKIERQESLMELEKDLSLLTNQK